MLLGKHKQPAILALEDGTVFPGYSFGAEGERSGEVVFNTGMTGYQEVLTDPSYKGQIPTMTYTEIGNYGINREDDESWQPWVEGFIVRENSPITSNWRATESLSAYLQRYGIPGIEGLDTRMLVKHLRTFGAQIGVISTVDLDPESVVAKAKQAPRLVGRDLVAEVTCPRARRWGQDGYGEDLPAPAGQMTLEIDAPRRWVPEAADQDSLRGHWEAYRVVVIDCGLKQNILRHLYRRACDTLVVPADTSAEEILAWEPDGVVLSNGPGDPEAVTYTIETTRRLVGRLPIFGVCLGQQILGLAMGGKTYKLKYGHRGGNHPVKRLDTGEVAITTQNHGFCVDLDSMPAEMELTHLNLNDNSNEGMRHREHPVFCVQYHPEAGPGPHDSHYLFDQFIDLMREWKSA
ncbi:MAG TPA: glutamine-hydrolyzing carbamoyl-phosphate synthase small subunit [Armatimonadota bacterium]|jgi:carbamoyl-phosphate synthase small subunit